MAQIKKPSQITPKSGINILLYGQTGIGKSTLALGAKLPLLIDFENGVTRVHEALRSDTVQAQNWCDVTGLTEEIAKSQYQSIIIDTYSRFIESIEAYIVQQPKMAVVTAIQQKDEAGNIVGTTRAVKPSLNGYGTIKALRQSFLKSLTATGRNIICVAQETETTDEKTGEKTKRPALGSGKVTTELLQDLDAVGYMFMSTEGVVIDFTPNPAYYTKNADLGRFVVPRIIVEHKITGTNTLMQQIIDKWQAIQARSVEASVAYEELLQTIKAKAAEIKDCETARNIVADVLSLPHMWDSKLQAKSILTKRLDELKITYNKATDTYEQAKV